MSIVETQHQKDAMLLHAIHKILLNQWDPLKIKHLPMMRDEYEDYLPHLFMLLRHNASETEIFEYLWRIESKILEKSGDREHTAQVSQTLRQLV